MLYTSSNPYLYSGSSSMEAISNVLYYEKETGIPIPSLEGVEMAKQWVEENQK